MTFKEVSPQTLNFNPFTRIGSDWMLITAGQPGDMNTMTASWGGAGVLWTKNVVTAYIRPQRYTKEFVDREDIFTLSFFDEKYRPALKHLGTVSGRGRDKIAEAGLTPCAIEGSAAFEEANTVLVCKKMYVDAIKPENFCKDCDPDTWYKEKYYHVIYIAEILKAFVKE